MGVKLARSTMPADHTREDFDCFGPVATKDTEFADCKLADLGCFKQDEGTDSNKYYHAAVVRSKKDGGWYAYFEYGRTKNGAADHPQFQFVRCPSESDAVGEFADQCAAKNTKRGKWEKVGSKDRYVPKAKKDGSTEDLYVVRYMASRAVGLPAAKNISNQDAVAAQSAPVVKVKQNGRKVDGPTRKLFRDLLGGAVTYTRTTMVGGTIPAVSALEDARDLLQDALKRVKVVGSKVEDQVADSDLKRLTYTLYGMIPKAKPQGAAESTWILSQENIGRWQDDLDAFETALKSANIEETRDDDVLQGIPADVEWVDPKSELGKFLVDWWQRATRNVHGHGGLTVHNLWRVSRHGDEDTFLKNVDATAGEMPKSWSNERPMFVDRQKERPDRSAAERKKFWGTNVALLFHGSRAINVPGIIRENFRFPNELVGVVINGAALGGGTYFADDWGKSANYCSVGSGRSLYAGSNGHVAGRRSFMFACEVILGNSYVAPECSGFTGPPKGHHCVLGKARHTRTSWSSGTLQNNEWVIYRKGRSLQRYLAELSW